MSNMIKTKNITNSRGKQEITERSKTNLTKNQRQEKPLSSKEEIWNISMRKIDTTGKSKHGSKEILNFTTEKIRNSPKKMTRNKVTAENNTVIEVVKIGKEILVETIKELFQPISVKPP